MADFREEAYLLEKMEITEDDDDDFNYEEVADSDEDRGVNSNGEEDDLNNFEALKAKTQAKMGGSPGQETIKTSMHEAKPRVIEQDVVVDDFIRNFL